MKIGSAVPLTVFFVNEDSASTHTFSPSKTQQTYFIGFQCIRCCCPVPLQLGGGHCFSPHESTYLYKARLILSTKDTLVSTSQLHAARQNLVCGR